MEDIEHVPLDHVALAVVLLKCKPLGVMLEDYFSALQFSLILSPEEDSRLLDGTKLWYTLFSQMQRQSLDVRAELLALSSARETPSTDQITSKNGRKRKPSSHAPNQANIQSKRSKTENAAAFRNVLNIPQAAEQHRDRSLLLRVMFGLARHPQGAPAQRDGLTHLICLACEAMLEGLDNATDTSTILQGSVTEPLLLNEVCSAIQHIWTSVVLRLRTTSSTPGTVVDYDMIIPQLCPLLQRLLQRLHQYCREEALEMVKDMNKTKRNRSPDTKSLRSKNTKRKDLFEHNCKVVTRCLAYILYKSNDIQAINNDAFHAMAAVFLEHLGSSITFRVFVDPDSMNNGILPPRGLSDTVDTDQHIAVQAAKLEAPYLIDILKGLMQNEQEHTASKDCSEDPQTRRPKILERLQESLLGGMFDDKNRTVPVYTGSSSDKDNASVSTPASANEEADEFLSQVWDVLGWDIILGKIQLEARIVE